MITRKEVAERAGVSPATVSIGEGSKHAEDTNAILPSSRIATDYTDAIREGGLRIPEDISVIGCDDIFLSETTYPTLTTIHIPSLSLPLINQEV